LGRNPIKSYNRFDACYELISIVYTANEENLRILIAKHLIKIIYKN